MGDLTPVNRALVVDAVVDQIRMRIVDGQLSRGDRLPPELELADKLGVGRNAVREALRTLEAQGWVKRSKRGTQVLASESDLILGPFANVAMMQQLTTPALFEVRQVLEGELAAMAAQKATPEEVAEIEALALAMTPPELSDERFVQINVSFHMAVAKAAKNKLLLVILEGVRHLLVKTQTVGATVPAMREEAIVAHKAIAGAIAAGNPDAARKAMQEHLQQVEHGLKTRLAGTQSWDL